MIMSFHFEKCSKVTFVVGLLQFLTSAILVGWALSVYWGLLVVVNSFDLPYLGHKPTGASAGSDPINDVAKFIAAGQPRSDQESYPAQGFNIGGNPGMINMGNGGSMYNPQQNSNAFISVARPGFRN
jgi:Ectodermal ciliogenesis protein